MKTPHHIVYVLYYPLNLGLGIAFSVQEREQGRFRGSIDGAKGRSKRALREHGGALRKHG